MVKEHRRVTVNVLNIATGNPVIGTTLLDDLVDVSHFAPALRGYLQWLVTSPEPAHAAVLYGWCLRWHKTLGFDMDPITSWWWKMSNARKEMFEDDARHELDTWCDAVDAAYRLTRSPYADFSTELVQGIRMRRDDLESLATVYPALHDILQNMDLIAMSLPCAEPIDTRCGSLILTQTHTPHCWWVSEV
jgi:hypothetical protein